MHSGNSDSNDPFWYKDGVIYQVHIKAYNDSNNDGIGDLVGLIHKLDYIRSLGVTIIWLLPFYPSPLRDDGYDIADYTSINPDYGTLDDFRKLLREAHNRGLKVITELVLNHTSERHDLFQKARNSPPGSPQREFYVWSDTPEKYKEVRIIFQDFESSNWSWDPVAKAYYWHRFYWHQPDLNFDNPEVHKYFRKVVDFWFEMGVDGMRLDAVPYLYEREGTNCENLQETHAYLKKLSTHVKEKFKNKMLLAEANQWPEDAVAYFGSGDECHMAFHFPLMPRIYMAVQMENRFPIIDILEQTPPIPPNCQWAMFLRNHDELTLEMVTDEERDYMYRFFAKDSRARINLGIRRRLSPLVENNRRKIELLNILLFSFPGTPVIYYGDEIGMGDNYYLGDRNGVRTPMQWSPDRNAGFSDVNPQKLYLPVIIDPEYHYETVNVSVQQRSSASLLWWIRRAISIRNNYKAFGRGTIEFLSPDNPKVLAFYRKFDNEIILTVVNLSRFPQVAELDLKEFKGFTPVELFSRNNFPLVKDTPYILTLNAYDYYWFALENKSDSAVISPSAEIILTEMHPASLKSITEITSGVEKGLLNYLIRSRLISSSDKVQKVFIRDEMQMDEDGKNFFSVIGIDFLDKSTEYFLLPISIAGGDTAEQILLENKNEIIAKLIFSGNELFLVNGIYDMKFREVLYRILNKKVLKGSKGKYYINVEKRIRNILSGKMTGSKLNVTDDNSYEIVFNDEFIIKFYKRIDDGINPGEEIQKYLTSKVGFHNIRPYGGSVVFSEGPETFSLGLIKEHVHADQSAWQYFLDNGAAYYEHVDATEEVVKSGDSMASLFNNIKEPQTNNICTAWNTISIRMIRQIGQITADLHLGLAAENGNADFKPEEFSMLYQRSLYQSMRSSAKEVIRLITASIQGFDSTIKNDLQYIWENEAKILGHIKKITDRKFSLSKIRIHGNLHLGNILFTGKDFIFINFEGAYSIPQSERRLKRSPLRDVASVILSLYFSTFTGIAKVKAGRITSQNLEGHAEELWYCLSLNFLESYLDKVNGANFIPEGKSELNYLLQLYTMEKLFLELKYYLNYEPGASSIPARALRHIVQII